MTLRSPPPDDPELDEREDPELPLPEPERPGQA
jgi:hypothetical protein